MFHERYSCHFCGRFVLEVEGWAESTQPYHQILAPWDDEATFFGGASYHLACLRSFDRHAEVRREFLAWITVTRDTISLMGTDGLQHESTRTGLGFTERVAVLASGEIYESPRFDRWVFVESAGPFHILDLERAETLGRGERLRGNDGVHSQLLPADPGKRIEKWDLPALLDFLQIRDLYQGLLDDYAPNYRFFEGGHSRAGYVADYSLSAYIPLPDDVTTFFAGYLRDYVPKRLEDA
ncbi:hypothetical protein [Nocardia sp. NPDC057668]|uniref:hypothetical protein n=1 Tax=Nocardia sp. NPDC057668 TaxID=3346202 RepID=UPI00367283CB